jgi:hypothetical protein
MSILLLLLLLLPTQAQAQAQPSRKTKIRKTLLKDPEQIGTHINGDEHTRPHYHHHHHHHNPAFDHGRT